MSKMDKGVLTIRSLGESMRILLRGREIWG